MIPDIKTHEELNKVCYESYMKSSNCKRCELKIFCKPTEHPYGISREELLNKIIIENRKKKLEKLLSQ